MASNQKKYNINSGGALKAKLNDAIVSALAERKYYQSRGLKILIGLSKIFHAVMHMYLYSQPLPWSVKLPKSILLCTTASLTYLIEYGLSIFWWRYYFAKFSFEKAPERNIVVCAWNPWYSGKYCVKIYIKKSLSFFQRLGNPVAEREFNFSDFFTESGYCLENKFKTQFNKMVEQALCEKSD